MDYVIGNKLGVGAEFERAFKLFSAMALSMIGMIVLAPMIALLLNLLPLVIFSALIAAALILFPNACVKVFKVFGFIIKALIILGLMMGIYNFLIPKITPMSLFGKSIDLPLIPYLDTVESGAMVCLNASIVMTGMFPLVLLISRLLNKPLRAMGGRLGIDEKSAISIVASLATSATTFGMMNDMNKKGDDKFGIRGVGHVHLLLPYGVYNGIRGWR